MSTLQHRIACLPPFKRGNRKRSNVTLVESKWWYWSTTLHFQQRQKLSRGTDFKGGSLYCLTLHEGYIALFWKGKFSSRLKIMFHCLCAIFVIAEPSAECWLFMPLFVVFFLFFYYFNTCFYLIEFSRRDFGVFGIFVYLQ